MDLLLWAAEAMVKPSANNRSVWEKRKDEVEKLEEDREASRKKKEQSSTKETRSVLFSNERKTAHIHTHIYIYIFQKMCESKKEWIV